MSRWQFTSLAEDDLFTIWAFIYKENAEAADRVESAIYAACDRLASNPLAGHVRAHLTPLPVRFWNVPRFPNYLIVYDPASRPLTVLRILHGARDATRELQR
jgi:plasmid stabilization system protein ParE